MNIEMIETSILIAAISISCFACLLSLAQTHISISYGLLGLVFLMGITTSSPDIAALLVVQPDPVVIIRLTMIAYAVSFLSPLTFFLYVRSLTGVQLIKGERECLAHIALPMIAMFFASHFLSFPDVASGQVLEDDLEVQTLSAAVTIVMISTVLPVAFYIQCLIYSGLALATEWRHRERLKELFASTEPYEIRWIAGMAVTFGTFASLGIFRVISGWLGFQIELPNLVDNAMSLLMVVIMATWGLRQAPGISDQAKAHDRQDLDTHIKYEKSALDEERATRICAKLISAMERDELFRDPNLSLMTLSKHIGVSTNYVSQSLNEHLGMSFFDFVNGWRVDASKPGILSGEQPITMIAYDVGFNSRSSFYTAFKKKTGLTPSKFNEQGANFATRPV